MPKKHLPFCEISAKVGEGAVGPRCAEITAKICIFYFVPGAPSPSPAGLQYAPSSTGSLQSIIYTTSIPPLNGGSPLFWSPSLHLVSIIRPLNDGSKLF